MFGHAWLKVTSPPEAFMAKDGRAKCWEHAGFLGEPNLLTWPPSPWGSGCVREWERRRARMAKTLHGYRETLGKR